MVASKIGYFESLKDLHSLRRVSVATEKNSSRLVHQSILTSTSSGLSLFYSKNMWKPLCLRLDIYFVIIGNLLFSIIAHRNRGDYNVPKTYV
jgi:hypothetical protein